jgi:hypothetical protein
VSLSNVPLEKVSSANLAAHVRKLEARLEAAEKMAAALQRCEHDITCNSWLGEECDCSIPAVLAAWEASK